MHLNTAFLLCGLISIVISHPEGAGQSACNSASLVPGHSGTISKSILRPPYSVTTDSEQYSPNGVVKVTLIGAESFRGFLIMATTKGGMEPIGDFTATGVTLGDSVQVRCTGANGGKGLTHTAVYNSEPSDKVELHWNAPSSPVGNIVFYATFVKDFSTYYVRIPSAEIWDGISPRPAEPPIQLTVTNPPALDTSVSSEGCGSNKGCFRSKLCNLKDGCDYLVSWKELSKDKFEFEIFGARVQAGQYVAMGIARDNTMADVTIIACQADSQRVSRIKHYYAADYSGAQKITSIGPADVRSEASLNGDTKVMTCRFTYDNNVAKSDPNKFKDLYDGTYHLFVARGSVSNGVITKHSNIPEISSRMSFTDTVDTQGGVVNALIKAHAAIMIIAWVFCGSIGLMLARYYKPMWTNSKSCGQKVWFSYHRALLVTMGLTLVGFVLILFYKKWKYSLPKELPHKAHPIIGLITIICVLLNPLLAAFRCKPNDKNRPFFNWFHWFFGTVAHIFAVVAIFLGMLFESVVLPPWMIYIMMIWVLFHVVCEFILEIHQCCMYDKNRDRSEEYEALNKGGAQAAEPKYAGRRFKCGMLVCYLIGTTILAIVMVVIVCVWRK